jgi:small redox-active disulfide protein 2
MESEMKIEVLGSGCQKCQQLAELTAAAITDSGIAAELGHVTDFKKIASYGVLSTPALVIDGKVKCAGRLPAPEELRGWLRAGS